LKLRKEGSKRTSLKLFTMKTKTPTIKENPEIEKEILKAFSEKIKEATEIKISFDGGVTY